MSVVIIGTLLIIVIIIIIYLNIRVEAFFTQTSKEFFGFKSNTINTLFSLIITRQEVWATAILVSFTVNYLIG